MISQASNSILVFKFWIIYCIGIYGSSAFHKLCDVSELFNLSEPWFPHLYSGSNDSTYLIELLWELNDVGKLFNLVPDI